MSRPGWIGVLRAGSALGLLVVAAAQANAGGFAVREQSTYGQGASFAGIAAGGSVSSMFWNPATMTQAPGKAFELDTTAIFPYASHNPLAGSTLPPFGGTSNTGDAALVPAAYLSYQLNPNLWVGLSINAPFGLSVSFPSSWAGRDYAAGDLTENLQSTPSFAYRFNDWISVGAVVQIQYCNADSSPRPDPASRLYTAQCESFRLWAGVLALPPVSP